MAARACVFLIILVSSRPISIDHIPLLIVWNVGQGQWISFVEADRCLHFDMGGEKVNWPSLLLECGRKKINLAYFSHWDWDHIGFSAQAKRKLNGLCLAAGPPAESNERKLRSIRGLPRCPSNLRPSGIVNWRPDKRELKSNDLSQVFLYADTVLPGDSTSRQEKLWSRELVDINTAKRLIVGHHGSKTSSSQVLLRRLGRLNQAVVSARFNRYGHPHSDVARRFRQFRIPLLTTEHWGDIRIELD